MSQLFVVIRRDRPNMEPTRQATRPAHLEWLVRSTLPVKLAGPLKDQRGDRTIGSLIVVEARAIALVKLWAAEDPYAKAGVFSSEMDIYPFTVGVGGFEADVERDF